MFPAGGNDVTTFQGKTIAIQMADIRNVENTGDTYNRKISLIKCTI
jgi:hypothetical protein